MQGANGWYPLNCIDGRSRGNRAEVIDDASSGCGSCQKGCRPIKDRDDVVHVIDARSFVNVNAGFLFK